MATLKKYIDGIRKEASEIEKLEKAIDAVRTEVNEQKHDIEDINDAIAELGTLVGGNYDG